MKLCCCIFAGGRPRVLSKFPSENQKNLKSPLGRWISPMFWMFFLDFAYEIALLHLCRWEAQGNLANFRWKINKNQNLHWVDGFPLCFGSFFWILLVQLRWCIFAGERTRVLSKFPLKYPQKSKSELGRWISPYVLGCFWILLMKLRCCIFAGGRPRVLSKFPLEHPQNSESELGRWISPTFWRFFRDFAYGIALVHFCRREAQGT